MFRPGCTWRVGIAFWRAQFLPEFESIEERWKVQPPEIIPPLRAIPAPSRFGNSELFSGVCVQRDAERS